MNECSGLQAVSEDDTIFVDFNSISSDMYCRPGVGSTGAVLFYFNKSSMQISKSSNIFNLSSAKMEK